MKPLTLLMTALLIALVFTISYITCESEKVRSKQCQSR